jgi:hypothetical protein
MTDRDGYWGAKIVASFSDEQIAAAVAKYEDPRARDYVVRTLTRRDKIVRHWFERWRRWTSSRLTGCCVSAIWESTSDSRAAARTTSRSSIKAEAREESVASA